MERKIHNFKSNILAEETIREYGYHPDKLGRTSTKFIIAICRFCGEPSYIRKGFYNKSGSACHKECKLKEQSLCGSPFARKSVREKSKRTNLARYGVEYASQNELIGNKISESKLSTRKRVILFLREFIEEAGFSVQSHSIADIYVPEKSFAIVYNENGKVCELILGKEARNNQIKKTKACRAQGIRLFHIFEHQWQNRQIQILNFIKSILGVNSTKVSARKCTITNDECRQFFKDNHIQGYGQGTIKYFNLVFYEEIVASMTASKHHRQNTDSSAIILNRLCFKDGFNIQGGSSKLFKKFLEWAREEEYNEVVSWSDSAWTDGGIYEVLGFTLDESYGPDYFYWDIKNCRMISKQSQQKKKTGCPDGMTEREWCIERGLYRIWGAGKRRWIFSLD